MRKKFQAYINIDRKMQGLGTFDTPKEAAQAYDRAAIQAGRPTSKLNFLDQVPKFYKPKKKKRKLNNTIGLKNYVKYKGIEKTGEKFRAYIHIDGKKQNLGTFDTPKEAAKAYDRAAIQAGRPTSKLNFLDQVPKDYKPKKKKLRSYSKPKKRTRKKEDGSKKEVKYIKE